MRAPSWLSSEPEPPDAGQIAGMYRQLRQPLEGKSVEPGPDDLYYSLLEMHRHALRATNTPSVRRSADRGQRALLTLYWLVSGYGQRATRALLCLAVTITVSAVLLAALGFQPDRSFARSLLFAVESSISLLSPPEAKLTTGGEIIQIVLRLLGPLFFGLALLALRGRISPSPPT